MWPLFKLSYGQLLKSSLARYCTHQETISGQLYKSIFHLIKIGMALEWWGGGGQNTVTIQIIAWTIIEVRPEALGQYCTHQKTISGRPEQKYLPSDPRSELPAEGALFKPACFH